MEVYCWVKLFCYSLETHRCKDWAIWWSTWSTTMPRKQSSLYGYASKLGVPNRALKWLGKPNLLLSHPSLYGYPDFPFSRSRMFCVNKHLHERVPKHNEACMKQHEAAWSTIEQHENLKIFQTPLYVSISSCIIRLPMWGNKWARISQRGQKMSKANEKKYWVLKQNGLVFSPRLLLKYWVLGSGVKQKTAEDYF